MAKAKSDKAKTIEHWSLLVKTYFDFCVEKFEEKPSFDGSSPRDLKNICDALKTRAVGNGFEWDEETAVVRFSKFLEQAYQDEWLSKNFLLTHLNRFKDKIFFSAKSGKKQQTENKYQSQVDSARANFKAIE